MSLKDYHAKRGDRTPEPKGGEASEDGPVFVIQKHDASTLHYDFRLEGDGALKSWAVPKGPSTDPREKRLAIPTEDHPIDYAGFEGVIPEGEYGAGTVLIWDRGPYELETEARDGGDPPTLEEAVAMGHVVVRLHGEKLTGGYALQRVEEAEDPEDERWLLVKMRDDEADARRNPVSTEPLSVASGRDLDEIRGDAEEEDG